MPASSKTAPKSTQYDALDKELYGRIHHLENCPAEHLESFFNEGPKRNGVGVTIGVQKYRTARCVDCGEQTNEKIDD